MAASERQAGGNKQNFRPTPLSLEQLEARMLMTVNSLEEALESLEVVGATKPAVRNAAPSIARAIAVAGGTTVQGTTASVTVLGRDDKPENQLTYTWSTTSVPSGGRVSFSASGNNAAKNTRATFTRPGNYELRVTITDRDGGMTRATQRVTVRAAQPAQPALTLVTANGAVAAGSTLTTEGTSLRLTSSLAATWTQLSSSAGGTGSIAVSGMQATITFNKAGVYTFRAVSGSHSLSFSVNVQQKLTTINVTPGTKTLAASATEQFTAGGRDQFGQAMPVTATWSTTAGSINRNGLLTAPATAGALTVRASSGGVTGSASVTVSAPVPPSPIQDANLSNLVRSLFADGSINRSDMMQLLRSTGADGVVNATELNDLRYIVSNAVTYAIPSYVQVLASNVVNANMANATYQATVAGNLAAGSPSTLLTKLVDKWFMGTDLPALAGSGITYQNASGPLFVGGAPAFNDQLQGQLGDCYFIAAVAAIAGRNPTAVANMFLDNGDGTFTVRFFSGSYAMTSRADGSISDGFSGETGTADYVTVNRQLPAYSNATFAYSNYGRSLTSSTVPLWIALAEKAYAQWNQTGKANRNSTNTYSGIEGGWMGTVNAQVLGVNSSSYVLSSANPQALINALSAGRAVTIGTKSGAGDGLVGSHAYSIKSYDAATQTFALHNPWGMMHPGALTWAQLKANCTWFTVANPISTPIATTRIVVSTPAVRGQVAVEHLAGLTMTGRDMAGRDMAEQSSGDSQRTRSLNQVVQAQAPSGMEAELGLSAAAIDLLLADELVARQASPLTAQAVDCIFDKLESLLDEAMKFES